MLETALDVWLVIRLLISIALGVRTANRLRRDETSRRAVRQMIAFHTVAACVTWVLETLIRVQNRPRVAGGGAVQVAVFPFELLGTVWVPIVDTAVFVLISAVISIMLVRWRLTRYRDELLLGEPEQRARAADACSFLGWLGRPALPELLQVISDPDAELRFRTARALGRVGRHRLTDAKGAVRPLLTDREERVRLMAASALGLLGETDPPVVDGVLAALAVDDEDIRGEAFRAIPKLGPATGELGAERVLALVDHWKYTWGAAAMLSHIGAPAVPALVVLLSHPKARVRTAAAGALGRIGAEAAFALPMLTAMSKGDANKSVRLAAKTAIGLITKAGPSLRL
jgi:hypothetical protein